MSKVIWLSYLSLLILGWLDNIRSPYFPDIIQSLQLNGTQGSLFFAVTSLLAFLTSLTGSFWLKRFSSLQVLQSSLIAMAIGFFLISRAPTFSLLLSAAAIFGIAYGVLSFVQNIVIQEFAPPALRRRIFTGLHSMYAIAALLAPLSANVFITSHWLWRQAFLLLSTFPLVLAIASQWLIPRQQKTESRPQRDLAPPPRLALWIAGLSVSFYMFGELGVSTRLVLWLRTEYAQPPEVANLYLAVFFTGLLGGRLLFTFLDFNHFSNIRVLTTSALVSAAVLVLALLHHPFWAAASGITMAPFYPVAMNHLADLFGPAHASKALAFGIGLCSLMTVVLHFTLGVLTDLYGLGHALWLAPTGLLLVVFFLYLQPSPRYN